MHNPLANMHIRRDSRSNTFGMVRSNDSQAHQGWDLGAPVGTPVYAISDGSIVSVQNSDTYVKSTKAGDAFGKHVTLEFTYCGATLYALYGHLSEIWCEVGDPVSEGWMLGLTGTTGNAQGMKGEDQHLHFQIMTGNQINHGLADKVDPGAVLDPLPANQAIVDSDPVIQMLRHMIPEIIGHH